MRVVHLTPMLPLASPNGDKESRQNLFLAFKAASVVLYKIQTDVKNRLLGSHPVLTPQTCLFPSVTEIDTFPPTRPPTKIEFTLKSAHDDIIDDRYLYEATLQLEPTQAIYVKFSQSYSVELHRFCAEKDLAPNILGFQRLSGGWFAVAMEKVNIVPGPPEEITQLEFATWKNVIGELVDGFHQEGLVHGDLRLANFIFTKEDENRQRNMLLVDFDWGGQTGVAMFPRGNLNPDLGVLNDKLDRPITEDDDKRALSTTFQQLANRIK